MDLVGQILSGVGGLGSLVCFIFVLYKMFTSGQVVLAIVCILCCGFGGLFSVKFPHISGAMLADKLIAIRESGAEVLVSNDCGCLMQIGGGLRRAGANIEIRHLAEVLASR